MAKKNMREVLYSEISSETNQINGVGGVGCLVANTAANRMCPIEGGFFSFSPDLFVGSKGNLKICLGSSAQVPEGHNVTGSISIGRVDA